MKRIGSFSLAIIVFTLSIVLCFPDISFADDATTLSKSKDNPFGYSSSEAQSYVSAHKDIYDSDHILLFSYTPNLCLLNDNDVKRAERYRSKVSTRLNKKDWEGDFNAAYK